jgi:hypothetical protein
VGIWTIKYFAMSDDAKEREMLERKVAAKERDEKSV